MPRFRPAPLFPPPVRAAVALVPRQGTGLRVPERGSWHRSALECSPTLLIGPYFQL